MQPIYTFNDTSIEIQIIEKGCYYKANIPNNEANKKLIENTIFKFEKSDSVIIMHDDNNVFQLGKMECSYSDYINMKDQLENNKKEMCDFKNDLLQQMKNEMIQLKNELFDTNNLLQKQINIYSDNSPIVVCKNPNDSHCFYGNEHYIFGSLVDTMRQDDFTEILKNLSCHNCYTVHGNIKTNQMYKHIIIPPKKILISFNKYDFNFIIKMEIYKCGFHNNIKLENFLWVSKEENIDILFVLLKNNHFKIIEVIHEY